MRTTTIAILVFKIRRNIEDEYEDFWFKIDELEKYTFIGHDQFDGSCKKELNKIFTKYNVNKAVNFHSTNNVLTEGNGISDCQDYRVNILSETDYRYHQIKRLIQIKEIIDSE